MKKWCLFFVGGIVLSTVNYCSDLDRKKIEKIDFFLEQEDFIETTKDVPWYSPGIGELVGRLVKKKPTQFSPKAVYGYLYALADDCLLLNHFEPDETSIVKISQEQVKEDFLRLFDVSLPLSKSNAAQAVDRYVNRALLEWLFGVISEEDEQEELGRSLLGVKQNPALFAKGKSRVNAYLNLVARYILSAGPDEIIEGVHPFKFEQANFKKPTQPQQKEIEALLDSSLLYSEGIEKGSLFDEYQIDLLLLTSKNKFKDVSLLKKGSDQGEDEKDDATEAEESDVLPALTSLVKSLHVLASISSEK